MTVGADAFQGRNIIVLLAKSIYSSLASITESFGVTPAQVGIFIVGVVVILLGISLYKGIRGRTGFSLEPLEDQIAPLVEIPNDGRGAGTVDSPASGVVLRTGEVGK